MRSRKPLIFVAVALACAGGAIFVLSKLDGDPRVNSQSGNLLTDETTSNQELGQRSSPGDGIASRAIVHSDTSDASETEKNDEQRGNAQHRPVEVLGDGFVTSDACVRCHQDQHKTWHESYHRTMTQLVSSETAPSAIEEKTVSVAGEVFRFEREGERYFVHLDDPLEPSSQVVKREMVLMTGSHHMNVFWYESEFEHTPAMLPVVYLRDQDRWIKRSSAFIRPPGPASPELGRWNDVCSRCHSTHPRGRLDETTSQWDTHVAEFGISCEACHGPGEGHVAFHDAKATGATDSQAKEDDVVVSPAELPHHLQSDVCGQCHSFHVHDFESYGLDDYLQNGMPFRPGDDLDDSPLRTLVRATPEFRGSDDFAKVQSKMNVRNGFWADGTVRVSGREFSGLIESPCYQNGKMSCLSCHEMHPDESVDIETWKDDQLRPGMRTNEACTQCHKEDRFNEKLTQHTHHAADSHGSNCMNCHMPHTTFGLLKSIRSHRIESPSVRTTLMTGRPNGCVLCHLDRDIGWAGDKLSEWYDQESLDLKGPLVRETASGVVNLMMGDAGLRAIYASAYAWPPAREVSGTDWMAPYLLITQLDEYDAVRIIGNRSLKTLPGWENVEIDEYASPEERAELVGRYLEQFKSEVRLKPNPAVLFGDDGVFQFGTASKMFNSRDRNPITLEE